MDDTLFEVKPVFAMSPDNNGNYSVTIDSGVEDKNRTIQGLHSVSGFLSIDTQLKTLDETFSTGSENADSTKFYECRVTIKDKDIVTFEHTAKYAVTTPAGEPQITFEEVEEEVRSGWLNALSSALFHHQQPSTATIVSTVSAPAPVQQVNYTPQTGHPIQLTQSGERVYTVGGTPLPTSWLVIAASMIAFTFGAVLVFVAQSVMNTANANSADTTKAQSSFSEPVSTVAHTPAQADASSTLGINPKAFAEVQKQTVTDMLKDMGIDPTHNQQDLSCLVE